MRPKPYLENLNIIDTMLLSPCFVDANPLFNDTPNVVKVQSCNCQIMSGVKDQNIASPMDRLYGHHRMQWCRHFGCRCGEDSGKVIHE